MAPYLSGHFAKDRQQDRPQKLARRWYGWFCITRLAGFVGAGRLTVNH